MPRLSRRKLIAGMCAAPWLGQKVLAQAAAADPVLLLCGLYSDLVRRGDSLLRRWSDREAWLGNHRDWFRLSDDDQERLPEARLLYAIDAEYERCTRECARLLRRLRSVRAMTLEGAIAKLSVSAEAIEPDHYPSPHRVLLSVIADLRALQSRR